MSEWKIVQLGSVSDVRDGTHDSPKQVSNGKPLVTSRHLKNGKIILEDAYNISLTDFEAVNKRSKVDKYDILFSMIGTVGEMALIDFEPDFAIKNIGLFKTNGDKDLASWIFYYLKSKNAQEELDACLKGSTQQYITLGDLRRFPIALPPLPEQKAIASVLSSLDDKIDLLHRQNKTLVAMAETLFRQWFIENEEGEEVQVTEIIDFNPKESLPKGSMADYLEMASVQTSTFHPTSWYKREFSSGTKYRNFDTLLARITPCLENGKSCYVTFLEEDSVGWGSTEFIVMRARKDFHPFITYALSKNQTFRDYAEGCMEGSSGRQRVNNNYLKEFSVVLPSNERISLMNDNFKVITELLHYNFQQVTTLIALRDTLLPKLMSGEVKVLD